MKKYIFARILLTYLCAMTAIFLLMIPLYRISLSSNRQAVIEEQNRLITQRYQDVTANLEFLQQFAYNLSRQNAIHRLAMCDSYDKRFPICLYDAKALITQQTVDNPFGCELIFTFPRNGAVVTTERVFEDKSLFYGSFFGYRAWGLQEWEDNLHARSLSWNNAVYTYSGRDYPAITYNFYYEEGEIVVSIVVDAQAVLRHIATSDILESGWIELRDTRYGSIARLGSLPEEEGLPVSIQPEPSLSSLQIAGGVSETLVEQGVAPVRALLWLYTLLALSVFILLSVLFTLSHAFPLWQMMQSLREFLPSPAGRIASPYKPLWQGVDSVVHTYDRVRQERDSLGLSHRCMLIDMALRGSPISEDVEQALREIPFSFNCFRIGALSGENGQPLPTQAAEELYRLACLSYPGSYLHNYRDSAVLFLAVPPDEEPSGPADWPQGMPSPCCIGISQKHGGAGELGEAFREASRALACSVETGQSPTLYSPDTVSALPQVDRIQLWNILLHEGPEEISSWFDRLLRDESLYQEASAGVMLYYHIMLILRQLHLQFLKGEHFSYPLYRQEIPLEENYRALQGQALALHQALRDQKPEERGGVLEEALAYIRQSYRSPALSLSAVAAHVGLSERYLSAKIADKLGCSYIDYVNRLRMEEAERLLRETDLSVSEVAVRSGYEYANTFFKAFRRWSGMTPTQYRKEHKPR